MLISLIERYQDKSEREIIRYGNWSAALRHFENACEEGDIPEIADLKNFLDPIPESQQADALCDLIAAHMKQSWAVGKKRKLDSYLIEFPNLGSLSELPISLIEDEFLVRYLRPHGDFPEVRDYENRFSENREVARLLHRRCLNDERYIKLHQIGSGATSVVWEGFDHLKGRSVAIKIPLLTLNEQTDGLRPFKHEVEITSQLNHLGIVGMTEGNSKNSEPPFYVMRLAGKENLSDRIQTHHRDLMKQKRSIKKRRDWKELLQSVTKVCDAIEYAHNQKILHCDLKPGNVICDEDGGIGIIDWGMARKIGSSDRRIVGTPDYMPPEQADGIPETRSDVFGLGAILYEALTGQPPFSWVQNGIEARPNDWADQVRAGAFPAPRKIKRSIPKLLDRICRKAMALKPEDRYQSAADLSGALRSYSSTKPGPLQFWRG